MNFSINNYSKFNYSMPKVNFKSTIEHEEYNPKKNNSNIDLSKSDYLLTLAIGALCGVMTQRICTEDKAKKSMEKIQNLIESNEIKKDNIIIKDVTKDDTPDIILETKDGKKFVFDLKKTEFKDINKTQKN